jgi:dethiobiotin synthetase
MQTDKVRRQEVSNSKLLAIIATALIAVLSIPVIIPHITRTGLIYHILVHIALIDKRKIRRLGIIQTVFQRRNLTFYGSSEIMFQDK